MKKFIILIFIAVAAALPVVPYYIGTTVEENFRLEHQEGAREAALSGVEIELVDYQRQLFNATATSRISISDGKEKFSVELHHQIEHTPQFGSRLIATVTTELVFIGEAADAVAAVFKGESPLTINTQIFLDGHQEATLSSPAARGQLTGEKAMTVEWQGLQGSGWQSNARDKVTFTMSSPGLVINPVGTGNDEGTAEAISLSELRYEATLHKGESGIWQGEANGTLNAFDIDITDKSGAPVALHIDSITMQGEQSEDNGLMKAGGAFTSKGIDFNGFKLTNAIYDVEVENIDAGAMRAWQANSQRLMKSDKTGAAPLALMTEHLPALFNAQPVLRINDLSVDSPMGRFALKLDTRVVGQWNDMLLQNPVMLAALIKADIDASVPRATVLSSLEERIRQAMIARAAATDVTIGAEELQKVVTQTASQQLEGLIGQGFIKVNGEQLESQLRYTAGQLTVNGVDASQLIGALMQ